jgi:hypothetical protein
VQAAVGRQVDDAYPPRPMGRMISNFRRRSPVRQIAASLVVRRVSGGDAGEVLWLHL